MRVIAVCSGKGGVGKTSAAVNLAALAARSLRVVLWDLDPQGGATQCLGTDTARRGFTKELVRGRRSLVDAAIATQWEGLAIVAADRAARNVDRFLDADHSLTSRLRPLGERYDVVVLDCPPGDDALVAHVVAAADGLFVSLVPNPMSIRALDQFAELVA